MLFSLDWMRSCCPVDRDAQSIAEALTDRGLTVDALTAAGDDWTLDVDIPANRPDCLGHLGLARELSAAFSVPLVSTRIAPDGASADATAWARVEIMDNDLCPRYTASLVRQLSIEPSPDWVIRRLEACGLRSINNVVDASNLVLLELGHPIHFFDYERLRGTDEAAHVVIRRAREGERLTTLDGHERTLDAETLVIADRERPLALAGVIGGADSEISDSTREVLIEAAHFSPVSIRATARRLGVQTDASYRFERGVDPGSAPAAQALALRLLADLAGGRAEPGLIDAYPGLAAPRRSSLRVAEVRRLLGYQPGVEPIRQALEALQLAPIPDGEGTFEVTIPSWRIDLEREADLVEEVARHIGYDEIPAETARLALPVGEEARPGSERGRDVLASLGFHEAVGYAMIARGEDDPFVDTSASPAIPLHNPIAEPMSHLRRSILPGLLRACRLNLRRGNRDVRLFESGHVFLAHDTETFPAEPSHLGIAWSGSPAPEHWASAPRDLDLYDVIGVVERVLRSVRPRIRRALDRPAGPAGFHPGRSFRWKLPDGTDAAWGGALHPELQARIEHPVFLAELDLDALSRLPPRPARHSEIPRVPAVVRDLAIVTTGDHTYGQLLAALGEVAAPAPVRFKAVDRYEGPPLAEGEYSLTLRVTLEPLERTLTDAETEAYRHALIERLRKDLGVVIRT